MEDNDTNEYKASSKSDRKQRLTDTKEVMKNSFRVMLQQLVANWNLESERFKVWKSLDEWREQLWYWLRDGDSHGRAYAELFGLVIIDSDAPPTVYRNEQGEPAIEIHSVRPAMRRTIHGNTRADLVVEITQRRRGYFDRDKQAEMDRPQNKMARKKDGEFKYRAGCTILIDPRTQEIRRVIRTPGTVTDNRELDRVRKFLLGENGIIGNSFDAGLPVNESNNGNSLRNEPFALLHDHEEIK
ncbi:hypothetical protein [uncultured Gimesia sp.]|uniref:hypothetical protein n=1 Tax=uncultured Gimesia sp. TaxID=1678688 RepID=UPI0030D95F1C